MVPSIQRFEAALRADLAAAKAATEDEGLDGDLEGVTVPRDGDLDGMPAVSCDGGFISFSTVIFAPPKGFTALLSPGFLEDLAALAVLVGCRRSIAAYFDVVVFRTWLPDWRMLMP